MYGLVSFIAQQSMAGNEKLTHKDVAAAFVEFFECRGNHLVAGHEQPDSLWSCSSSLPLVSLCGTSSSALLLSPANSTSSARTRFSKAVYMAKVTFDFLTLDSSGACCGCLRFRPMRDLHEQLQNVVHWVVVQLGLRQRFLHFCAAPKLFNLFLR